MIPILEPLGEFDAIVPVPLHPARLRKRGYNQSGLLAAEIGRQLQVPVMPVLVRTRDTVSQVTLSREDRQTNLSGAFGLDPGWAPAPGTRFLMIDDVRTTGATLNACAKELVRTGPRQVTVATLALDLPRRELGAWLAEHGR
ncbi:MAG: ComF family protein [Chloroflexia bacterium]|nr:ComF family protein [Chloroflexia bacterium]